MSHPDREGARILTLKAELGHEVGRLERVVREARAALAAHPEAEPELVVVRGVGGLVHGFYTGIEKVLVRIERGVGSGPPDGPDWHRELLQRAAMEIPGLRPAVVDQAMLRELDALRRFQHLFRNLYAFDLEWTRVQELATSLAPTWTRVRPALERFSEVLGLLAGPMNGAGSL